MYVYLANAGFANTWVRGGRIPIPNCQNFVALERRGTMTLDEGVALRTANIMSDDLDHVRQMINFSGGGGVHARRIVIDGREPIEHVHIVATAAPGFVLSMCTIESLAVCYNLKDANGAPKRACVRVPSPEALVAHISEQLGIRGQMGLCEYTATGDRGPFRKSYRDAWQTEFRAFWPSADVSKQLWVVISPGSASMRWAVDYV